MKMNKYYSVAPLLLGGLMAACASPDAPRSADAGVDPNGSSVGNGSTGSGSSDGGGNAASTGSTLDFGNGNAQGEGGAGGGEAIVDTTGCGDGLIQNGEACDDGNSDPADGCSADCSVIEKDFACPNPGDACVSTVKCGDGKETCDDGNAASGDGCDASCELELGWKCGTAGAACVAAACGDGIIAGNEQCDDGNAASGDGCDASCQRTFGFHCAAANQPCTKTICGDGVAQGDEACDDGNDTIGDGCNHVCEVEPNCGASGCTSTCGDGMILSGDNEECDDGNNLDGDGCDSSCKTEKGFSCTNTLGANPNSIEVFVTLRDLNAIPTSGNSKHPDFNSFLGSGTKGLVQSQLGLDGKPVYTGICELGKPLGNCPSGAQTTSQANFFDWYNDTNKNFTRIDTLVLNRQANGVYRLINNRYLPFETGAGLRAQGKETGGFGFTSEIRHWFEYKGGEKFDFAGDDDVWVFINNKLALDLGGLHGKTPGSIDLDAQAASLGLKKGTVYELAFFHAERQAPGSNFELTLSGFDTSSSVCTATCGDGVVAGDEICDDGINDGSYGGCNPDCTLAPTCGDGQVQAPQETCDDGTNLTTYNASAAGCAPGCKLGGTCGDGTVDSLFGEACDQGAENNDGSYGGCTANCALAPRCGDKVVQEDEGENCDDGNTVNGDGCDASCRTEEPK